MAPAALLLATASLMLAAPLAHAATITLSPVADSYVMADQPTVNFGTATSLRIDGSPVAVAYLKFDVQGLTTAPAQATLKVVSPISSTTPINAKSAGNAWTETGLTYDNRPAIGQNPVASDTPTTTNDVLSFDVTSLVGGNGLVSIALDTTSSTSKSPPSRENPTVEYRPQLVIDTGTTPTPTPTATATSTATTPAGATVIALGGDVACGTTEADYNGGNGTADKCRAKYTAGLINSINPSRLFAMGDLQYNSGSLTDFNGSYANSWGAFKSKTNPVVGNHEYGTSGAAGYFSYFGDAATPRQPGCTKNCDGFYSFNVPVGTSSWHIAVINGECTRIGGGVGCAVGSPQYNWLKADLEANASTQCTAVLTHKPRWSSSSFYTAEIQPLVDLMGANKVDLLLAGHAHSYERFAPQTASGSASSTGIRQITVGTGGRDSQGFGTVLPNSVVRKNHIFGVMKLTLSPTSYSWSYVPDPTTPFSDSGSGNCV
ncbi:MAG TPA: DNRLRE domain-containing protein [Propionibacteriaceae bacterium]